MSGEPLVIAHRGASSVAPENTLVALATAVALGADGVEFDVRATADGVPVLLHDATVDRTTDASGDIASLTWAQVQRLDAGRWFGERFAGERVPSLEAVLEWAEPYPTLRLFVELKGRPDQHYGLAERLCVALESEPSLALRTHVIAFDPEWLVRVRQTLPGVQTGLIYSRRPPDPVVAVQTLGANALIPAWQTLTADDVRRAHDVGLTVYPWTVDTAEQVRTTWRLGLDGFMTNDVALARRAAYRAERRP